jgi:Na+-translocating ferredoxin:NAD+ oxidoreductase RnfC subunit
LRITGVIRLDINELKKAIMENGVVGAGGAGFPSHAKLSEQVKTIVLNGAECEPLFRTDRQLLAVHADEIMYTLELMVEALGAENAIIALKPSYKAAIAAIENNMYKYNNISLHILKDIYPAGDEIVLIYETTGKIVPEGALPLSVGVMVNNVETVYNIYKAVEKKEPVTDKYLTVTGQVKTPVTLKIPVGTCVKKAIELAGGPDIEDYEIILGGPMTGRLGGEEDIITKTTKAIIVLPKDHLLVKKRKEKSSINLKRTASICSQCQMCTDLCPRHLLGYALKPNKIMNAAGFSITKDASVYTASFLCSECGLCKMYSCHQGLSPRRIIGELKSGLRAGGVKNPHHNAPESVNSMRYGRLVPEDRLIPRLGILKYNTDAPMDESEKDIKAVKLALSQHIGAKASPVVKTGDTVTKGQLIGQIPEGKLGARIHASISGTVSNVDDFFITIAKR